MKHLIIFSFLSVLCACSSNLGFETNYYEQITKIKFPEKYKVVATADNGEFVTITIIDVDKETCKKFVSDNNFKSIDEKYPPNLGGLIFLEDTVYQELPDTKTFLIRQVSKEPGQVGWTYLVDTTMGRLYCEINYPDWGGN